MPNAATLAPPTGIAALGLPFPSLALPVADLATEAARRAHAWSEPIPVARALVSQTFVGGAEYELVLAGGPHDGVSQAGAASGIAL